MNNLQVFLNVNIKQTGFLAGLGNFFLAPVRFFFSGKTVIPERDMETGKVKREGNIAKVSSFFISVEEYYIDLEKSPKVSKQLSTLKSEPMGSGPAIIFTPLAFLVALIPFTIIGSIFKALSYFSSKVRDAHTLVKNKLTYKKVERIGAEYAPIANAQVLENQLSAQVQTGQKIEALIINATENAINDKCLEAIKNINPLKLILVGNWNKDNFKISSHLVSVNSDRTERKRKNWDLSALDPQRPANAYDYSVPVFKRWTIDEILAKSRATFFAPKHKVYVVSPEQRERQVNQLVR